MCRRWFKLCQGVRGRGHLPPASPCQVLCGCHLTGPTRTPTRGAYHSPLERRPGSEKLREPVYCPATRASSEPGAATPCVHPPPWGRTWNGAESGTARPLPVACSHTTGRTGARRTAQPRQPMEAPPHLFRLLPLGVFLSEPRLSVVADPGWCHLGYHAREFSARPYLQNPGL